MSCYFFHVEDDDVVASGFFFVVVRVSVLVGVGEAFAVEDRDVSVKVLNAGEDSERSSWFCFFSPPS